MTDPESLMMILKKAGKPVDSMDTPLTDEQKALMSPKKTSITAKTQPLLPPVKAMALQLRSLEKKNHSNTVLSTERTKSQKTRRES